MIRVFFKNVIKKLKNQGQKIICHLEVDFTQILNLCTY